jgi:hypothetical protein
MSRIYLSILLAFALWAVMFVLRPLEFLAHAILQYFPLGGIALTHVRPILRREELTLTLLGFSWLKLYMPFSGSATSF